MLNHILAPNAERLLILEETVTGLMDDGNTADVVYLDFAKTFDLVIHGFL